LREDLYVVLADHQAATNAATFHAYLNPLVMWLWLGGMVLTIGTMICLLPEIMIRHRAAAPAQAAPARKAQTVA